MSIIMFIINFIVFLLCILAGGMLKEYLDTNTILAVFVSYLLYTVYLVLI